MGHARKTVSILLITVIGQVIAYVLWISPFILGWGASNHERRMPMPGDDMTPYISSTRAIDIHAPVSTVWEVLAGLGADRNGFYSYTFIERALGYESLRHGHQPPEHYEINVGRIVPGSMNENNSMIEYNFPVVYVDPPRVLVLENWGTFLLEATDPGRTRLIVRSHGQAVSDLKRLINHFSLTPAHYLMERRMMLGIKARAEADGQFAPSSMRDIIWFGGIMFSGLGIILMAFIGAGDRRVLLCFLYGLLWLNMIFVLQPEPGYSLSMLFLVLLTDAWFLAGRKNIRPDICSRNI